MYINKVDGAVFILIKKIMEKKLVNKKAALKEMKTLLNLGEVLLDDPCVNQEKCNIVNEDNYCCECCEEHITC